MSECATLSKAERTRRAELEQIVDNGAREFLVLSRAIADAASQIGEAGISRASAVFRALTELCDRKLFRTTHESFAEYVRDRWPALSKSRAYELINGVQAAVTISAIAEMERLPAPTNEAQVRPLAGLNDAPEIQVEAWRRASTKAKDGPPAGWQVEEAVDEVIDAARKQAAEAEESEKTIFRRSGKKGRPRKDRALKIVKAIVRHLRRARNKVKELDARLRKTNDDRRARIPAVVAKLDELDALVAALEG